MHCIEWMFDYEMFLGCVYEEVRNKDSSQVVLYEIDMLNMNYQYALLRILISSKKPIVLVSEDVRLLIQPIRQICKMICYGDPADAFPLS